jgi:phage terminase large subunit
VEKQRVEINYAPRVWAQGLHAAFQRWAALVLHRRAGKTTAILNHHQRAATDDVWELKRLRYLLPHAPEAHLRPLLRNRVYWHVMPTLTQARLVAWDMLKEFSRPIPGIGVNNTTMLITYPETANGRSKLQLLGADDPDSLRGPALSGLSLDEYSQIPSHAFGEVLSKALGDHLGYCIFSGTIKGKDQLYQTHKSAAANPDWYAVWQDIDVSLATESGPTITALTRAMEDDRKLVLQDVMTQAEFDQEWYLSPEAAIKGAIYGPLIAEARKDRRIGKVPYEPLLPVDTAWDLGVGDATAIWFVQSDWTGALHVIDYHEASGEGLPYYAEVLRVKGYTYGQHWGPHDIEHKEFGSGRTRIETARSLGIHFQVVTKETVEDGIHAVRMLLPKCWFDETKCAAGLEALTHYRWRFDNQLNEQKSVPMHDWASHGADAFRYLALRQMTPKRAKAVAERDNEPPHPDHVGRLGMGINRRATRRGGY